MNFPKMTALALMVSCLGASSVADARGFRGHANFGFYVGPSVIWPGYYPNPYPYYGYYPPVVISPPVTYVEQGPVQGAVQGTSGAGYWYYCRRPEGYYPYVKQCPDGWQQVAPRPAS